MKSALIVLSLVYMLNCYAADEKEEVKQESTNEPAAEKTVVQEPLNGVREKIQNMKDPFSKERGKKEDMYVTLENTPLPEEIQIKGVMLVKGQPPVAVLEVPGYGKSCFVKEKDVIRLKRTVPAQQAGKGASATTAQQEVYLEIRKIKKSEIEVSQQARPDQIIILR